MKYLPVRQWGWRGGAAGGREGGMEGGEEEMRSRWRKAMKKKTLTPHWLPIGCTFLSRAKVKRYNFTQ